MAKLNKSQIATHPPLSAPDGAEYCLTRAQVAERLQISPRHVQNLEARHAVPVLRAGRAIRYDAQAWDFLINAMRVGPEGISIGRISKSSPSVVPKTTTGSALKYLYGLLDEAKKNKHKGQEPRAARSAAKRKM